MINFIPIPNTDLEISSSGKSHNRIIFIRLAGMLEPMEVVTDARLVLIGRPYADIRNGMKAGAISRPKLAKIVAPVSGDSYQKLRAYTDLKLAEQKG